MEFNFEEFEREFNKRYRKRSEPPEELKEKWEENSKKLREFLLNEDFIDEVRSAEISELEINIMHTALLSFLPDMQTQIDLLRERVEQLESFLRNRPE